MLCSPGPSVWGQRFSRFAIVLLVVLVGSANISNSFLLRWGFKDRQPDSRYQQSFSLVGMMDGQAPRPFVYRSGAARALKWLVEKIPQAHRERLHKSILRYDSLRNAYFPGIPDQYWTPTVSIVYHLMYLLVTLTCMTLLWLCWRLARMHDVPWSSSLGLVTGFSFVYPLTFQQGGYYYDFIELACALGATYTCLSRRWLSCVAFVTLGSLNKETFFLVPAALMFAHDGGSNRKPYLSWLIAMVALSLSLRWWIMHPYSQHHGVMVEHHALDNLLFWLDPRNYLSFYNLTAKGILTPSLQNPLFLVPAALFLRASWRASPAHVRRYVAAIWLPLLGLYAAFGYKDELRALAIGFPALWLVVLQGAPQFAQIFGAESRHATALQSTATPAQAGGAGLA